MLRVSFHRSRHWWLVLAGPQARGHYAFLGEVWIKEAQGLAGTHVGPPSC